MNSQLSTRALVCVLTLLLCLRSVAQQARLLGTPFSEGLPGWTTQGRAEFGFAVHEGRPGARITVAPGVELAYQQIHFDSKDVRPGDAIDFRAVVRTVGQMADGVGPYLAIEWLNAAGQRIGVLQSMVDLTSGRNGWQALDVSGTAPAGTAALRANAILHSHGTAYFANPSVLRTSRQAPWPDLGDRRRTITVEAKVLQPDFIGIGFHAFQHAFDYPPGDIDRFIYPRWRELNPSFVRVNHEQKWGRKELDRMAEHLRRMQSTGARVYVTTWDPKDCKTDEELAAYARRIADHLEYLIREKKCHSISWYCLTNELSLERWGSLAADLPKFKRYHEAFAAEFKRRNLKVGLLATDASPISYWPTVEWAAKNMDEITAVYGAHHYFNDATLEDERFYEQWLEQMKKITAVAKARGKPFILGEFGSRPDGSTVNGVHRDRCVYYETPQEAQVGIQISEGAIGAMNAGAAAVGYWTFMDLPDSTRKDGWENKWGLVRCGDGADYSTRAPYYAYGLLTRYFRGPSSTHAATAHDPRLRVAASHRVKGDNWSIAVVNRNTRATQVEIRLPQVRRGARLHKYVYDPAHVAQNPDGKLPPPSATFVIGGKTPRLRDTLLSGSLTVYSTE